MPSGRGQSSRSRTHTDTHAAGQTDRQRQRWARAELTAGQRSDERPGGGETALHPTARSGGRRPRGERGVRALAPRQPSGLAAPPSPAAGGSVRGSTGLRAVPRRYPAAVQLSALPRAAPSAPPERQHRRAPGPGSERGAPEAHGARRPCSRPSPPLQAPFLRRPPTVLLLSLGAVPRPELRSLPRCARRRPRAAPRGLCGHLPRPACPRVSAPLWSLSL